MLTFLIIWLSFLITTVTRAITVEVPGDNLPLKDVNVPQSTIEWNTDDFIILAQQINKYLWFSIAAVCMAVAVYAGYKLLMADGKKENLKKANEVLVWAIVGIFLAIFAYVLVRIVVNLF